MAANCTPSTPSTHTNPPLTTTRDSNTRTFNIYTLFSRRVCYKCVGTKIRFVLPANTLPKSKCCSSTVCGDRCRCSSVGLKLITVMIATTKEKEGGQLFSIRLFKPRRGTVTRGFRRSFRQAATIARGYKNFYGLLSAIYHNIIAVCR